MVIFVTSPQKKAHLEAYLNNPKLKALVFVQDDPQLRLEPLDKILCVDQLIGPEQIEGIDQSTRQFLSMVFEPLKADLRYKALALDDLAFFELYWQCLHQFRLVAALRIVQERFPGEPIELLGRKDSTWQVLQAALGRPQRPNVLQKISLNPSIYALFHRFRRSYERIANVFGNNFSENVGQNYDYLLLNCDANKFSMLFEHLQSVSQKTLLLSTSSKLRSKYQKQYPRLSNALFRWFFRKEFAKVSDQICHKIFRQSHKMYCSQALQAIFCGQEHLNKHFVDLVLKQALKRFAHYLDWLQSVEQLYSTIKLKGLVLWTDELPLEKCFILTAKALGISSVVVQHGARGGRLTNLNDLIRADYLAVFGQSTKRLYIEDGLPEHKMAIVGSLQADRIMQRQKSYDKQVLRSKYGYSLDDSIVLVAAMPFPKHCHSLKSNETYEYFQNIASALKGSPKLKLIVKCRGAEDLNAYAQWAKDFGLNNVRCVANVDLHELIYLSDLLVSYCSTVVLEGILLQKLVVMAHFFDHPESIDYAQKGAVVKVSSVEELKKALEDYFLGQKDFSETLHKAQNYAQDYVFRLDGRTAERILDLLKPANKPCE